MLNPNTNPNFSYNWENINVPGVSVGTGAVVNNLPAGVYVLESQYGDSLNFGLSYEGCTNRDTVEITQIDEILINGIIFDVDCYGNRFNWFRYNFGSWGLSKRKGC